MEVDATADDEDPKVAETAGSTDSASESPDLGAASEPPEIRVRVATCTLADRSAYQGEVDATGEPHGVGVQRMSFGVTYAGEFRGGRKHGAGVQALANGAVFAGTFVDGQPSGFGVYTSPLTEKFVGEWRNGARDGVGMIVDADAEIALGRFAEDELLADEPVSWRAAQECVQLALVAERRAIQSQEAARERQLEATLAALSAVETMNFQDAEQIAAFEVSEQRALEEFVLEQSAAVAEVERVADALRFREAELKQQQKRLRAEIDARAAELSFAARYCALASERAAQADAAERTLRMLQVQLEQLEDDRRT